MSIKNIHRNFKNVATPSNIYRYVNGEKKQSKKIYKVIDNKLVKVWDILEVSDNRLVVEGYCSGYYQFKYTLAWLTYSGYTIKVPNIQDVESCTWSNFTIQDNITGIIDWGDGSTENYNSNTDYTHDYFNNACEYFQKNYNSQYGSVYFKITITFDKEITAIINPSFFYVAEGYNRITTIHFPDSCKYLPNNMSFDNLFNDIPITLNVPRDMQVMTCYPSGNEIIQEFNIPDSIQYLGLDRYFYNSTGYYSTGVFQSCKNLKTLNIPKSVKMIGSLCFHNCSNLQTITGLEGVEGFGYDCFSGCDSLEPFNLPDTTKYILAQSFDDIGIRKYYGYDAHDFFIDQPRTSYLDFNCNAPMNIYLVPDNCIFIGYQGFATCYWFRILSLPSSIKYIAEDFYTSGYAVCEIIYRGSVLEWFNIKFTETDEQTYNNITDFFNTKQITDKTFYKSLSDQMKRIICNDGIIINPYTQGSFKDGTQYTGYGDNCFDSDGKAIKENFLILN